LGKIHHDDLIVTGVDTDALGSLHIQLSMGLVLEVFPMGSADDDWYWYLRMPDNSRIYMNRDDLERIPDRGKSGNIILHSPFPALSRLEDLGRSETPNNITASLDMGANLAQTIAQQHMQALVGKPIWDLRYCGFIYFNVGERKWITNRKGQRVQEGEYGIGLECSWRLRTNEHIICGSWDLNEMLIGSNPQESPSLTLFEMRLMELEHLEARDLLIVQSVECDVVGGFRIDLSYGLALEAFPCESRNESEFWHLSEHTSESETDGLYMIVGLDGTTLRDPKTGEYVLCSRGTFPDFR